MKRVWTTVAIAVLAFSGISIAQDVEETPEPKVVDIDDTTQTSEEVVVNVDNLPTPDDFLAQVFDVLEDFVSVAKTISSAGLTFGFLATLLVGAVKWFDNRFLGNRFKPQFWQTVVGMIIVLVYWIAQHFGAGHEFIDFTEWLNAVGPRTLELLGVMGVSGLAYTVSRDRGVPLFGYKPSDPTPPMNG